MCVTTPVLYTRVATCRVMALTLAERNQVSTNLYPRIYTIYESWSGPSPDRRPVAASSLMIYEIGFIP